MIIIFADYALSVALAPLSDPRALEPAAVTNSADMLATFGCEICMSLLSRRAELRWTRAKGGKDGVCGAMQGFDSSWRAVCEQVADGLTKYDAWVQLWEEYYGCHKITPGGLALVAPCPAHVVCSWVAHSVTHLPFCPADHTYRTPHPPGTWREQGGDNSKKSPDRIEWPAGKQLPTIVEKKIADK
jgi:hypothetical protein